MNLILAVTVISIGQAPDLARLPANTWIEIKYATEQPAGTTDRGEFARQGWNKIVYDPDGKRVLFYDRWLDKKHGGQTIYGNCLFALDPAAAKMTPVKIDHWTKYDTPEGGYRTIALPENDVEPTPCPRHVYHAFEYVADRKSVYLCNGANQTVVDRDRKLVGHDECDGAWKLDLTTNRWSKVKFVNGPRNRLDEAMAWSPRTREIIYAAADRQVWILNLDTEEWRKSRSSPPQRTAMGQTVFYDPPRGRMLLAGGGLLDAWQKGEALEFRELYGFDPKTETVKRLADAPTALYSSHLAYDAKRDLFFVVAVFDKQEQRSGMFAYDLRADAWNEVHPSNPIPPHGNWFGWMQLCYDSDHDCLIGKVNEKFFVFRYQAAN